MDSAAFLTALEDGLRPQVEAAGGRLEVATDPDHVLEILAGEAPKSWRVILNWAGDEAVDETTSPGIVYWSLAATIQAARGLAVNPGADAHRVKANGRDPLMTLKSKVSRWIRGFSGDHQDLHCDGFRYVSGAWLVVENLPTRQITLTHRCILALDEPINTPCTFS
jgi:hypothetical protein